MALTPASILADYSSGIGTQGATLKVDANNERVGIGTTNPQGTLQVGTAITMGSGIITATSFDGSTATFSGNVSVGGTLTYEDVTSVDSVGIVTARSDVIVGGGLSVTGISTFNGITTSTTTLFANDFSVSGVSTLGGNVVVGGATTDLVVNGDARVTGILTVGTASLTLDGTTGKITGGSLTDAQVAALSTSIVGTGTTVDVFVYDTSKDSDGGAWRKRTQHTSWYNEAASSTRGSRQEFPAVAVIVAETDKVTIYDGDDPDLPMWMVFTNAGQVVLNWPTSNAGCLVSAIYSSNGILSIAKSISGVLLFNFVKDDIKLAYDTNPYSLTTGRLITDRNNSNSGGWTAAGDGYIMVDSAVNDVAMTVLPNAPIDETTGLPVPTIAVATDGGVSVIRDDQTVFDISYGSHDIISVSFNKKNNLNFLSEGNSVHFVNVPVPSQDHSSGTAATLVNSMGGSAYHTSASLSGNTQSAIIGSSGETTNQLSNASGGPSGLTFISNETPTEYLQGAVAYATTSYNTGWMHGDIKGAFLSDTSTTNVTGSNLIDVTASEWSTFNGSGTVSNPSAGVIRVADSDGNYVAYQDVTNTVVGKQYILSYNTTAARELYVEIRDTTAAILANGNQFNYTGTYTGFKFIKFTATTTTTRIMFSDGSGGALTVEADTVELRVAEEDRSVNQNGLQVFGEITKSPVAGSGPTAAELVAYHGVSATNYLKQPYNSDLNFGTGDFSIFVWVLKNTLSSNHYIIDRAPEPFSSTGRSYFVIDANGYHRYRLAGGAGTEVTGSVRAMPEGVYNHIGFVRKGGAMEFWMNGELVETVTGSTASASFDNGVTGQFMTVDRYANDFGSDYTFDRMALLRISGSAPSAEQVKKMYEDEKVLFQENAKATLYGSSDAVTALAYDDDEETLYVGTSSGRSDFRGLRRINNTTTAVTTAISASNGLVAEE